MRTIFLLSLVLLVPTLGLAADPFWPGLESPKLITPQWIGEEGVEAVVVLSIDDMTDPGKYEAFLRPILDRLKQIDGRAPVSISTLGIDPKNPQLQDFLQEGLSIESHTMDHPCPLLAGGDFEKCRNTVMMNIDLLNTIPNMKPVAFRMPCCDSMNAVSPRFYAEILHKTTVAGNFLQADSSVFNLFTPEDPALPKELIAPEGEAKGRFDKYVPHERGYVSYIENYPYPYVIGGMSWQIPGTIPSDWEGHNCHGAKNPKTIEDLKAAIDCTVVKQGIFTLVFHPHGWIENTQVVELIDHVVATHGNKVKFLNLREVVERLNGNLLGGDPLRGADGQMNKSAKRNNPDVGLGVTDFLGGGTLRSSPVWPRIQDWTGNGYFDVTTFNNRFQRNWDANAGRWLNWPLMSVQRAEPKTDEELKAIKPPKVVEPPAHRPALFTFSVARRDVDLDGDGDMDCVFSTAARFGAARFDSKRREWEVVQLADRGERDPQHEIPMIVRADGSDNGAWFKDGWMYIQNEDTGHLPGQVEKRRLSDFLKPLPAVDDLPNIPPKEPEDALQSLRTRPELSVELVAAEPLVLDPVDIAWGPDGKLWLVEMADYPNGMDGKGKSGGRVRFLEDEDGDGRYEKSTLFLDGLNFPTGVMPWRGGVLVAAAPEILFASDSDGDGKADKQEVLYDGFRQGNPQHRVNGLRWGLDNWIYLANGDSDGTIRSLKTGETVNLSGRDLRIRPDEGLLELQSGETQFGRCRDEFGNWFGNNNSNALWHFTLHEHYLRRNPHVASPDVLRMVPAEKGRLQLYPASTTVERFNDFDTANMITSACGTGIYRDDWLGGEFSGNAFICEPVHNLVTRQVLRADGLSFTSERAEGEETSEVLASSDNWFRPVTVKTGPDGALYVVDMYRHVIEHPEWIPGSWQKRLNLRAGEDKGRIYRLVRRGKERKPVPNLASLDSTAMVDLLPSANGELRDMIHIELVRRGDVAVATSLRTLPSSIPVAVRGQVLSVLDGLGALSSGDVLGGMRDPAPEVRQEAVRLAENVEPTAELVEQLGTLCKDPDLRVRHQVHLTLGSIEAPGIDELIIGALGRLKAETVDQALFAAGLLSSVTPEVAAQAILAVPVADLEPVFSELVDTAKAGGGGGALLEVATRLGAEVAAGGTLSVGQFDTAAALAKDTPELVREALTSLHVRAVETALDLETDPATRLAAVRFLGVLGGASEPLATLVGRHDDLPEIPRAAAQAFADGASKAEAYDLLADWDGLSPAVRRSLIDAFLGRPALTAALVERGREMPSVRRALTAADLERLRASKLPKAREAAEEFANDRPTPAVAEQLARFTDAAALAIDAAHGRELFGSHCALCHQLEGTGNELGPDLTALTNRSFEAFLAAVVDPNAAVEDKYLAYLVTTSEGESLVGSIEAETATSLMLVQPNGEKRGVLRKNLKDLRSTGRSLMPEGFGAAFSPQDMADLVAYVQQVRPAPKEVKGNTPSVVQADGEGALSLTAASAAIYGPRLTFGAQYNILEFWESERDFAVWRVDCAVEGNYKVELEIGCETGVENRFQVVAGSERVVAVVPQTKSWIDFDRRDYGTIHLRKGAQEIVVRSNGPVNKFLMDLRGVYLTPVE